MTSTESNLSTPTIFWTPTLKYEFTFDGRFASVSCACKVTTAPSCASCVTLPLPTRTIPSVFYDRDARMDGLLSRGGTEDDLRRRAVELCPDVNVSEQANSQEAMFKQDLVVHTENHWQDIKPASSDACIAPSRAGEPHDPAILAKDQSSPKHQQTWLSTISGAFSGQGKKSHSPKTKEEWKQATYFQLEKRGLKLEWEDIEDDMTGVSSSFEPVDVSKWDPEAVKKSGGSLWTVDFDQATS